MRSETEPAETQRVLIDALRLDPGARALIAETLLESLDLDYEVKVSDDWREEIRRRCADMDSGAVTSIDSDEVFAALRAKYGP